MILPKRKLNFLVADRFPVIRCGLQDLLVRNFAGANVMLEEDADGFWGSLSLMCYDAVIVSYEIAREVPSVKSACVSGGFGLYPSLMLFEFSLGDGWVTRFAEMGFKGVLNKRMGGAVILKVVERMLCEDVGFVYAVEGELVWG